MSARTIRARDDAHHRRLERGYARDRATARLAPWQERLAKDMMKSQLCSQLALADIAILCRVSLSHFVRAFSNTVGIAPYHWYLAARIDFAKALLVGSALPLAQVALECGFVDQSHFTHTFVRYVGVTPGRWRRVNPGERPVPAGTPK